MKLVEFDAQTAFNCPEKVFTELGQPIADLRTYDDGVSEEPVFVGLLYDIICAWSLDGKSLSAYGKNDLRLEYKNQWYDEIPEQGVLCWISDVFEKPNYESTIDIIAGCSDDGLYINQGGTSWKHATPLTNDEIKQFLREE